MNIPMRPPGGEVARPSESQAGVHRRGTFRRIFRRPLTSVALGLVVIVFLVAVTADLLAPFDPEEVDFTSVFEGPSPTHWLGTDEFGRDVLSRLVAGTRVAFVVSLGAVGIAAAIGVPFGLFLGYRGGWWDRIGSRAIDISDALPGILVAFAIVAVLGRGLLSLVIAIALVFAMALARMSRAVTLAEREKVYVHAAQVSGLKEGEILFRQILPNLIVPLTAQASLMLGSAILIESTLSFLNLGVQTASWGGMLSSATTELPRHPFMVFPPGVAIVVIVLSFNIVANGISDVIGGTSLGVLGPRPRESQGAATVATRDHDVERPLLDSASHERSAVLEVRGVTVKLPRMNGEAVPLVENAWLSIAEREVLGLLGESGSGKSMLARSILGLLPRPTYLAAGTVLLDGEELTAMNAKRLRKVRGRDIAAVFQNPITALSPVHTIGKQISEPLRIHIGMSRTAARTRATELLDLVGVDNPKTRFNDYPHQFSGGMAQRVAIAMALAAEPKVLIADEATSALDVTTQAQVLDLLLDLRDSMGMTILMITHDLGVIAETCDRAAVMYAGQIVEVNDIRALFEKPQHPYTAALLASNPSLDHSAVGSRPVIRGLVPPPGEWPNGCHFAGRCDFAQPKCTESPIPFVDGVRCVRSEELTLEMVYP